LFNKAHKKVKSSRSYKDYRGKDAFMVWRYIPTLEWGIVVKMDTEEAMEPILVVRNQILLFSGIIVIIMIFFSSFISKSIIFPIRQLTEVAEGISKGDMDVKWVIKSKDEIGDLSESFERMLAAIKFYKEERDEKKDV